MNLASYIDHTLLRPEATSQQIRNLCDEAMRYGFASVCVNPVYVRLCREFLQSNRIAICTVAGFPLGASLTVVKALEAEKGIEDGATEIDMVMNIGALKDKRYNVVLDDIRTVKSVCGSLVLKVIIETAVLTQEEKIEACRIIADTGADFVKTSTGFGPAGATIEDVRLLKEHTHGVLKVKASGGIRTRKMALDLIAAGADRLGTSSSIAIIQATDESG